MYFITFFVILIYVCIKFNNTGDNEMRVIAGSAKGHKLETIEGLNTRPTTDRIKETLFNIIAFDLPECVFLDLFSGSGAIGIEALSRGAQRAVLVEQSDLCGKVISRNLEHTRLAQRARLMQNDVLAALDKLAAEGESFDIIFMDPPYAAGLAKPALEKIVEGGLLRPEGYVIVERSAQIPLEETAGLYVEKEKKYKTTVISFLRLEEQET
nr:16S rRNA (guanine(966)-N(2))-methyltransferase RsmD [Anaerotignum lactatifermentans]